MEVAHVVNMNYENELYGYKTSNSIQKVLREYEFIYFLINQSRVPLLTDKTYSSDYENHLSKLGFNCEWTNRCDLKKFWWGDLSDLKIERKLNSKTEFVKILYELGISTQQEVTVLNEKKLNETKEKFKKFYIKLPTGMSGKRSVCVHEKDSTINGGFIGQEVVLSPFRERQVELSAVFSSVNDICINLAHYNSQNVFSGGMVVQNESCLIDYLNSVLVHDWQAIMDSLRKDLLKISEFLMRGYKKIKYPFSVDVITYVDNGQLQYEFLELNYRRSMGLLLNSLRSLLGQNNRGELMVSLRKDRVRGNGIRLSPENGHIQMYFSSSP